MPQREQEKEIMATSLGLEQRQQWMSYRRGKTRRQPNQSNNNTGLLVELPSVVLLPELIRGKLVLF